LEKGSDMPTQEEMNRMNEVILESVENTNECIQNLRDKLDELNKLSNELTKAHEEYKSIKGE